jgi:Resolvase, N terminal domain
MEKEQRKIAIYARVSTKNGQDPGMQLAELREYIRNRKWKIAGEYVDKGISGASDSRPELNRLMADANRRRFDVVAVWKFDRFARSVSHLLRALETFRALGIEFVSLSENIDTSTPTGKMVFTVLATFKSARCFRLSTTCSVTKYSAQTSVTPSSTAVPEPGILFLLGPSLVALAILRRCARNSGTASLREGSMPLYLTVSGVWGAPFSGTV